MAIQSSDSLSQQFMLLAQAVDVAEPAKTIEKLFSDAGRLSTPAQETLITEIWQGLAQIPVDKLSPRAYAGVVVSQLAEFADEENLHAAFVTAGAAAASNLFVNHSPVLMIALNTIEQAAYAAHPRHNFEDQLQTVHDLRQDARWSIGTPFVAGVQPVYA